MVCNTVTVCNLHCFVDRKVIEMDMSDFNNLINEHTLVV